LLLLLLVHHWHSFVIFVAHDCLSVNNGDGPMEKHNSSQLSLQLGGSGDHHGQW
jgi:hypothetical protein